VNRKLETFDLKMKISSAYLIMILLAAAAGPAGSLAASNQTVLGQSGSSNATLSLVQGIVVKDPTSEPIKKALIELIAESQNDGSNYTAVTDADGRFVIENIAPGQYRLFVERAGYREVSRNHRAAEGRVVTLSAGNEMKDVVIHLQAAAVVDGRVSDEDGDPMPDSQVAVLRRTYVAGHSHWEQVGAERTNDLGEYRIAGLGPGSYFVSVSPPPNFRSLIEANGNAPSPANRAPASSENATPTSYQTTYYPGTRDRGQAEPILLHAGDDFPVNFSLMPSPALSIRGTIVNLQPSSTVSITVQGKDSLVMNGAEMHKDGSFEIHDVAPGSYTILARVENGVAPMMARQPVQITSANVEGLRLAPQAGAMIRAHLRLEFSGSEQPDPRQMFLRLCSVEDDDDGINVSDFADGFSTLVQGTVDGSFEWRNVSAGRYAVQISDASEMPEWFLKSVAAGGRDVLESGFNVSGGAIALDVVASDRAAAVEGVVTNQKGEAVADSVVVAVPEARFRNHPERYRKSNSDQSGRFTLRGLPPGDYTLLAWESMDGKAYLDPEFLKLYEGQGRALHAKEGERAASKLKVIPASEDEP
jgi:hypothetical protein